MVERMCVACRKTGDNKKELRFVIGPDGQLAFDVKGQCQGRGAYLCASLDCFAQAQKKRAFFRALPGVVVQDFEVLLSEVRAILKKRALDNLGLAFRSGACVAGRTKVIEAEPGLVAILQACDLSVNSEINGALPILVGPSKVDIGRALGRDETGIVGLMKARITDHLICDLERWSLLNG